MGLPANFDALLVAGLALLQAVVIMPDLDTLQQVTSIGTLACTPSQPHLPVGVFLFILPNVHQRATGSRGHRVFARGVPVQNPSLVHFKVQIGAVHGGDQVDDAVGRLTRCRIADGRRGQFAVLMWLGT